MTLVHPWLVVGMLLAVIPILIDRTARRRHRMLPWAATDLLDQALQQQEVRLRRSDRLLLAVRVQTLLVAPLALARPVLTDAGVSGVAAPAAVIVVDRSGSMRAGADGQTRLAAARARVGELLASLSAGSRIGAIAMDDRAVALTPGLLTDRPRVAAALSGLEATWRGTQLEPALAVALDWLKDEPGGSRTVYVVTDGQERLFTQEAAAVRDRLRGAPGVGLRVVAVGRSAGPNVALADLQIVEPSWWPAEPACVRVRVAGGEGLPGDWPVGVALWVDGRLADRRVAPRSEASAGLSFHPLAAEPGLHVVEARLDGSTDEPGRRRLGAWVTPRAMGVVTVSRPETSSSLYLHAALTSLAETGPPWTVRGPLPPAEAAEAIDESVWLVILADAGALPAETAGRIVRLVERGGACWIAGGPDLDETLSSLRAGGASAATWLGLLHLGGSTTRPAEPLGILTRDAREPGSRREQPEPIDLSAPGMREALEAVHLFEAPLTEPATDSPWRVALRTTAGRALLLTHTRDRVAVLSVSLGPGASDWVYRPAFVAMVDSLAQWLCRPRLVAASVPPGWLLPEKTAHGGEALVLVSAAGERRAGGGSSLEQPGVWRREGDAPADDARRAVAVNPEPAEGRSPVWSPQQIASWLPPGPHAAIGPEEPVGAAVPGVAEGIEVWPVLAGGLLALLAIETLLAHRFAPGEPRIARAGVRA